MNLLWGPLFSKELPTCAISYDVLLELPPHITDATFKSSSLKAFLEKGQVPEFLNPAQVFFTIHKTASAEVIILVRSRKLTIFFFRTGHHPTILCNSVFCLKRPQTTKGRRLCVQCRGRVEQNILLRRGKKPTDSINATWL